MKFITVLRKKERKKNIYGTFIHGIFDNDDVRELIFREINPNYKGYNFKEFKANAIKEFAEHIEKM